jgi:hypothetical protein
MAKHFLLSILIVINDHAKYINKSTHGQGWWKYGSRMYTLHVNFKLQTKVTWVSERLNSEIILKTH